MTARLAKLADVKSRLSSTETAHDAMFGQFLDEATAEAERLAGRPLVREQGVTEYPWDTHLAVGTTYGQSRYMRLRRFPIESITSIKQLYAAGDADDFTAADALVEGDDYVIPDPPAGDPRNRGRVERLNSVWYLHPSWVQAIYTAGFADPSRIRVALATATYTAATRTLTQTGAFTSYTFAAGDAIVITGGTGARRGTYQVASKPTDDAIVLSAPAEVSGELATSGGDLATGDITSAFAGMIDPPADLRGGVVSEAIRRFKRRDKPGVTNIALGGAAGSVALAEEQPHPSLVAACERLKVLL